MSSPAHPHGDLNNPDTSHETSDINVRAILMFVIVLTVISLLTNVAMWGMFKALDHYEVANEPYVTPLSVPAGELPLEPRLQTTPWSDLKELRANETQYLHSYGWVDEKAGVARIPIEKAKEMLLQRGIPVRVDLGDALEGTHQASLGESNSGRTLPAGQPDTSSASAPHAAAPATTAPAATAPTMSGKPGGGGA